jgi:hypothetical protein
MANLFRLIRLSCDDPSDCHFRKWLWASALYLLLSHSAAAFAGLTLARTPGEILHTGAEPDRSGQALSGVADSHAVAVRERAVNHIRDIIADLVRTSYPELVGTSIEVKPFVSRSDYFQSRFSIGAFLTRRQMQYILRVNPAIEDRDCPETAIRAIVAHELAHMLSFKRRNRLALLGLIRLASADNTREFERRTDLLAISRGYSEGLKEYRRWLYRNVPKQSLPEKYRDYFSPEELDAINEKLRVNPRMMDYWLKHVPRNLAEIKRDPNPRRSRN